MADLMACRASYSRLGLGKPWLTTKLPLREEEVKRERAKVEDEIIGDVGQA